jgi:hypothetical protein
MLFADLLQWISLGQKTGTLVIAAGSDEKRIYFRDGKVIASASNNPREYLSEFLMTIGGVDESHVRQAIEAQGQSKMLLGKILVMIDSISEPDLMRLMRLKAEEEIYDLFLWPEGEFQFIDDDLPKMEMIPLKVDVTGVVMEGTRRLDEWQRMREVIPDFSAVPVVEKPVDQSDLSEVEKLILQCVNGHRTLEQISSESHSSRFLVAATLVEFVRAGAIRFLGGAAPAAAEPEPIVEPPPAQRQSEEEEVSSLLSRAQTALQGGEYEKSLRLIRAAQSIDPGNAGITSALKGAETVIGAELRKDGISLSRIPRLTRPLEEITDLDFTPNEGFLLSRINGMWDVGSIVKISPMRETEALLIFHRLRRDGIIEFK